MGMVWGFWVRWGFEFLVVGFADLGGKHTL